MLYTFKNRKSNKRLRGKPQQHRLLAKKEKGYMFFEIVQYYINW